MLTALKVSSLARKCVFYRTKKNSTKELNIQGLEMQKWDIPTDRALRVHEKYGVIFLVMMFTPGGMVIKMYVQLKYSFAEDRKILLAD